MQKKHYHPDIEEIETILLHTDEEAQKRLFMHAQRCKCCAVATRKISEEIRRSLEDQHHFALEV